MNEKELRALLTVATQDRPEGIEVVPSVAPRRARVLVPAMASAGVVAAVGVGVVVVPGGEPSAQAQVASAVRNTTRESFRIQVDAGVKKFDGAVDPVRHVGVIRRVGSAAETRFIGPLMYVREDGGGKWQVYPRMTAEGMPGAVRLVKFAPQDPQAALQELRSATRVRASGKASGEGWTGRRFTFALDGRGDAKKGDAKEGDAKAVKAAGSVEVDDEGRVRRLELTFQDTGQRDLMSFGAYGTPVSVEAPPAEQVEKPKVDKKKP